MKKNWVIFLSIILIAISAIFVPGFNGDKMSAHAITNTDTTSYVEVGELWDGSTQKFSAANFESLLNYIGGKTYTQFADINTMAEGGLDVSEMRQNVLTGASGTTLKSNTQDIVVTLGGLKWQVVYLSQEKNSDPILTLWLSSNTQEAFNGKTTTDSGYRFYNSAMFSKWSAWKLETATESDAYPSNMYGTSYIRSVALNNGGYYSTAVNAISDYVQKTTDSVFALYTMEQFGLTDYLVVPKNVPYQTTQRYVDVYGSGKDLPNEAAAELTTESWTNATFDYTAKKNYFAWANDYLWLPSITEVGENEGTGIWKTSLEQRKIADGSSPNPVSGLYNYSLLRTALPSDPTSVRVIMQNGSGLQQNYYTDYQRAVRPALHLNLKEVYENVLSQITEDYSTIYLDPTYGDDQEKGLTRYSAVKSLTRAEELVEENGTVFVMNTISVLEDATVGENKAFTLKRFYKDGNVNFIGNLITAGKYTSATATDNVRVKLTLKNVAVDGNRNKNGAGSNFNSASMIIVNNADFVLDNTSIQNSYSFSGMPSTPAVVIKNASTLLTNDSVFRNLYCYNDGVCVNTASTADIIFNNTKFYDNEGIHGAAILAASGANGLITFNNCDIGVWVDANEDGIIDSNEKHGNSTPNYASLLLMSTRDLVLNDCSFMFNNLRPGGGAPNAGLIHARNITVKNSYFGQNTVSPAEDNSNNPPGIFNSSNNIAIENSVFEKNTTNRFGCVGAMTGGSLTIKDSKFIENQSKIGGVFYLTNTKVIIENSEFESNKATDKLAISSVDTYGGGVLYAKGCNITVKDSKFITNEAILNGGVFVTDSSSTLSCYNSYFEGNRANKEGTSGVEGVGGVGKHENLWEKKINYYNCEFYSNYARSQGGCLTNASVYDCYFEDNSSGYNGGAASTINAYNSKFIGNTAYNSGGALVSSYEIDGCYFDGNKSQLAQGGAISIVQVLTNSTFVGNSSPTQGGAVHWNGGWFESVVIKNCSFEKNFAEQGAAIFVSGNKAISLENLFVKNNVASSLGGGIYISDGVTLSLNSVSSMKYMFIDNNYIAATLETLEEDANGDLIGSNQNNLYIVSPTTMTFRTIPLLTNLVEGSRIGVSSNAIYNDAHIFTINGVNENYDQNTVNAIFIDNNANYKAYNKNLESGGNKTGVGIFVKNIQTDAVKYTANNAYFAYDGTYHTIDINVISHTEYTIWYSTEQNGTYTTTPVTVSEPGSIQTVWFYIETSSGNSPKECRQVIIDRLELQFDASEIDVNLYLQLSLTNGSDISNFVKGVIYDIEGNPVVCSFIWADGSLTTGVSTHGSSKKVDIIPYNTERYKPCEDVVLKLNIAYENLYFKDNAFYPTEDLPAGYKVTTSQCSIDKIVPFVKDGGSICFLSTYNVSSTITISTEKEIYFERNLQDGANFTGTIISVASAGNLTIGSLTSVGKFVFDGNEIEGTSALITNAGTLNVYGNVTFKDVYNYSTTAEGGAISSTKTLNIDGAYFENNRIKTNGAGIYSTGTLTLKNTIIYGGYAVKAGAGLYIAGTAKIENCKVENNYGWNLNATKTCTGAGLYITGTATNVDIVDSVITGNQYSTSMVAQFLGGGLRVENGATVNITDCSITNNFAYNGGGIYVGENAKVTVVKTIVNQNLVSYRGGGIYTSAGSYTNFISGTINNNASAIAANGFAGAGVCVFSGHFVFGEDETYSSTIAGNNTLNANVYGEAVYISTDGCFEVLSGNIQKQGGTDSDQSIIHIGSGGVAKLHKGELFDDPSYTSKGELYVVGNLYISSKFRIPSMVYLTGIKDNGSNTEGKIYLMDDFTNYYISVEIKIGESTSVPNCAIIMADTSSYIPANKDEWENIYNAIKFTSVASGFSANKAYIYDKANNLYIIYIDTNVANSQTIYFDPNAGSNGSGTESSPVNSWATVLEKTTPGATVYLKSTWTLLTDTTIDGGGRILKRYYNASNTFTKAMIKIGAANVDLTIYNLTIDGNKTKNDTVTDMASYLASTEAIINCTNFSANINLFNNVYIMNGHSTTQYMSAGIYIKLDTTNLNVNLNIGNSYIVNNSVNYPNYYYVRGAGIYVHQDQNVNKIVNFKSNISNTYFIGNTIKATGGNADYPGGSAFAFMTGYNNYSGRSYEFTFEGCYVADNTVDVGSSSCFGGAFMFYGYPDSVGANNPMKLKIVDCDFVNNKAITSSTTANTYDASAVGIRYNSGEFELEIRDCEFKDNFSKGGPALFVYSNDARTKAKVNIENLTFTNKYTSPREMYIELNDAKEFNINNIYMQTHADYPFIIYGTNGVANISNVEIHGGYRSVYVNVTSMVVNFKNLSVYESSYYGIEINGTQEAYFENVKLINTGSHGISITATRNYVVSLKDFYITGTTSYAIYQTTHSEARTIILENVEIYKCYYGAQLNGNSTTAVGNVTWDTISATNVYIHDIYQYGFMLRRSTFVGNNVVIEDVYQYAVYLYGAGNISGIKIYNGGQGICQSHESLKLDSTFDNIEIYDCYDYGYHFSGTTSVTSLTGNITLTNIHIEGCSYGIWFRYLINDATFTIGENVVIQKNRYGFYMDYNTQNLSSNDFGNIKINIDGVKFLENYESGLYVGAGFYGTSNPSEFTLDIKNTQIKDNGQYGLRISNIGIQYTSSAIKTNFNIDDTVEINGSVYGIYINSTSASQGLIINGGNITGNQTGVYASNRIDITGGNITNNTNVDVYATKTYLSGNPVIGRITYMAKSSDASIVVTGNITTTSKFELVHNDDALTVGYVAVQTDGVYAPSSSVWTRIGNLFISKGCNFTVGTNNVTIAAVNNVVSTVNTYFFDPANRTGKANGSNNGKTVDTPFLNWSQVKATTKTDNSEELVIYMLSTFNVQENIDGGNRIFKFYISPTNNNFYFNGSTNPNAYMFSIKASVTVKNVIVDGNADKDGSGFAYQYPTKSSVNSKYHSNLMVAEINTSGITVNFENFSIRNYLTWVYNIVYINNATLNVKGGEYKNIIAYTNSYYVFRCYNSSVFTMEDAYFYQTSGAANFSNNSHATIKNCVIEDNSAYCFASENNNLGKVTIEGCTFTNTLIPASEKVIYAGQDTEVEVSDCSFTGYATGIWILAGATTKVEDCEFYNITDVAITIRGANTVNTFKNIKIDRAVYGIIWYYTNTNITASGLEITNTRYGFGIEDGNNKYGSTINLSDSLFDNNHRAITIIYASSSDGLTTSTFNFKNVTIKNSDLQGIYIGHNSYPNKKSKVFVEDCTFINNTTNIYAKEIDLTIKGNTTIDGGKYGIHLYNYYGNNVVVENVTITNQYQSAIYSESYFVSNTNGYTDSKFTMNGGFIDNNHKVLQQSTDANGAMNFYFNGGTITNNNGYNVSNSATSYSNYGNYDAMYFYDSNVYFSGSIVIECGIWATATALSGGTYASNRIYIGSLTSEAYLRFYTGAHNAVPGLCIAQSDPSVSFTATSWNAVLERVSIDHWQNAVFNSGSMYALITGDASTSDPIPFKDKILFFDPANTTTRASDENSGLYYNYPLLTFDAVKNLAGKDTVIYFISSWAVSSDMVIDGEGLTLTRYYSATKHFTGDFIQVTGTAEVTIKNLIFDGNRTNQTTSVSFRVITATSANVIVNVENCEFNNIYSTQNGAAIYTNSLAQLNVENSKFVNTRTTKGGGAIYVTGNITVNNCYFDNNRNDDTSGGGAIHLYVNNKEFTILIENSDFYNCYTASYGGAIRCIESANTTYYSYLTVRNCNFYNNQAKSYGSAILARSKETAIINCYFEGNKCTSTTTSHYGGVVDFSGPVDCYLEDCTFKYNYSSTKGMVTFQNTGSSYVTNCVFDGNIATANGLLAFYEENGSYGNSRTPVKNVYVDGVVFKNSTAMAGGANAIRLEVNYETEGEFIFENIDIIDYSVQNSIIHLRVKGKVVAVRNLYCENVSTFGACILVRQYQTFPVDIYYENITFKNCSTYYAGTTNDTQYGLLFADNNGTINVDGIYVEDVSYFEPMMIFKSVSNTAKVTVNLNDIHVKDTVLKRNNSSGYYNNITTSSIEGAIIKTSYADVTFTNSTFENNDVLTNPAVGIVSLAYGSVEADNVKFVNNRISGQVFRIVGNENGSTASLSNIVAKGNMFAGTSGNSSYGGGITVVGLDTANIDNVIVEGNTAYNAGGGLYLEDTIVYLRNSIIKNNSTITGTSGIDGSLYQTGTIDPVISAVVYGGGGIAVAGGKLIASNIEVVGNKSPGLGGGIAAYAPIEITDSIISNNKAGTGGGIVTTMDAFIDNVEINNNISEADGGGAYFASHLTITNSEIVGNITKGSGGGLNGYKFSTISNLTIENVLLKDNNAAQDGGAIYFGNSQGLFIPRNIEVIANTSYGEGTAIYSAVNFDLLNSKISGNYIRKNSLIYIKDVIKTTFKDNIISGNYGFGEDATLFKFMTTTVDGIPTVNIINTSIYGNMTEKQALILIVNDIYLSITDSSIYGNVNKGNDGMGGVINIQQGTLGLEKTVLQNNYAINGSAIYMNTGSNLLFVDSIITGHSSGRGNNYCKNGVVYIAAGAQAKFDGGVITQNKVSEANGVIYSDGVLNITKTEIYDNISLNGIVYNASNGFLSLEDINIHDNTVRNGGGVYNLGTAHFINGFITNNTAADDNSVTPIVYGCGGGVYNAENGIFTMSGGKITNNTAGNGGGVYNNSFFILNGGEIVNNTITHSGGGVYNDADGNFALNDGLIAYNTPKVGSGKVSGFGITTAGKMNMVGGEISNNYVDTAATSFADSKGGAIYATNGSHTQISGGIILDNLAGSGAGIYFDAGSIADIKYITIDNVTRTTSSKTYGRAIFANLSTINLHEVVFKASGSLTSNNNDGVIYALNSQINIKGCEFVNNKENVGIVYVKEGSLNIEDTMFKNNKTKFDANSQAIVYAEGISNLTIKNSDFISNETNGDGGAIKIVLTNVKFEGLIDNCFYSGNKAVKDGGAIAISSSITAKLDSHMLISNSLFESNVSERNGGALAINGGAGLTLSLLDNIFGGYEGLGNKATRNGGAIYVANNETSPISIVVNGQIEVSYNTASSNGGGIYTELNYPGNTPENYYNFYFNSGVLATILHNTDSKGASNLYVLKTTNLNMLLTGIKAGSEIGITLADAGGAALNDGETVIASYKEDMPLTTTDFEAFFFDKADYSLRLDAAKNAIVVAKQASLGMVVTASDKVFGIDGTYKTITADDITVSGATDVTITFATAENGIYSATAPKYISRGTYTIWYKVVDNTGSNDEVIGSLTLKITGKILLIEKAPTAYLNKGESLEKATFRGGLVTNEASAVAGVWQFENLATKPTDTTTKYKLIFKPYNTVIYENTASVYIPVSMSFYTVYYYDDGTTSGFFNDRTHTSPTGITRLPEMVDSLRDMGIIYFMSTYEVGKDGLEEVVTTNRKVFMARYAKFTSGPIIRIPENATPIKFTLGGGIGEFSFHALYGYSTQFGEKALFENYGIMTVNSNVILRGFTNRSGGASLFTNYESGVLYLNGCEIFNNYSTNTSNTSADSKGGVLDNRGTTYINGGDFRLNYATGDKERFGGFAYNTGLLVINSGLFVRNIARYGGLIYSNGGSVTLNGGDIIGNYANGGAGGAVYATNGAQVNVNGARIISNISTSGGAGIHSEGSNIFINGGKVRFNIVSNAPLFEENKQVKNNEQSVVLSVCYVLVLISFALISVYFYLPKKKKFKINKRK